MGKYLVTGGSGTGKSTLYRLLKTKGYTAFVDDDSITKIAAWRHPQTGLPAKGHDTRPVDPRKAAWLWDSKALHTLLDAHENLFLFGNAYNQLDYHELFDKVFVLVIDPETQRQRIMSRTEHDHGKSIAMQTVLLQRQRDLVEQAVELGAIPVDAMPPVSVVADDVITKLQSYESQLTRANHESQNRI